MAVSLLISHILTAVSPPSTPQSLTTLPVFPGPLLPSPVRKEQASQGYQLNSAEQDAVRLGTNPPIQAGQASSM